MSILLYNNKIPRDRVLELELPRLRIEGWVTVELGRNLQAHDKNPIILRRLRFKNLIVDAGLDQLGGVTNMNGMPNYIAVGTSSTAPAASDTDLVAPTGVRTNSNGGFADVTGFGASNLYAYIQRTRLFLEAESNGNLTEVGFFKNNVGAPMWMRQLFKDGGGTPTTIVKTASDQLRIIYELRVYPPSVDVSSTISISTVSYTYTHRAANIGALQWGFAGAQCIFALFGLSGWSNNTAMAWETNTLGATSSVPTGTAIGSDSTTVGAYTNGTFFRDLTHKWEPATANFGTGIGATGFALGSSGQAASNANFQTSWSPKFTKDNTKRLTLVTRISWGNH